jgi:hypothetical protein
MGGLCYKWMLSPLNGTFHKPYVGTYLCTLSMQAFLPALVLAAGSPSTGVEVQ